MANDDSGYVLVGRILRPHGVRGEVVVARESDVPERFAVGSRLMVAGPSMRREVEIAALRQHHDRLLVRLAGIEDRDAAESLRGSVLEVRVDEVPPPPPDSYYYFDLVGCRCEDRTAGSLGRVVEVIEDGGGLLLEVAAGGRSWLVPFVRRFILDVDLEAGRIELDLPPGLIEICESRS